jgi:RimJ/RimL family protein N-acetyltransferase
MVSMTSDATATLLIAGTRLHVRPIRPTDTTSLQEMHRGLSSRTVYQRFFRLLPELGSEQAEHFTHVDGTQRFALVAEDPDGALVAVARYERLPQDPSQAEIAVVVADAYQHHGLGTALVRMLRAPARTAGVATFVADVLATNRAMQHTFADAGLVATTNSTHGVSHLVMPIN